MTTYRYTYEGDPPVVNRPPCPKCAHPVEGETPNVIHPDPIAFGPFTEYPNGYINYWTLKPCGCQVDSVEWRKV